MTRNFAKLYETALGQILVMRQAGDEGPEITLYFDPDMEELGVCSVKLNFDDSDQGQEKADKAFAAITEDGATDVVSRQVAEIKEMFGGVPS